MFEQSHTNKAPTDQGKGPYKFLIYSAQPANSRSVSLSLYIYIYIQMYMYTYIYIYI